MSCVYRGANTDLIAGSACGSSVVLVDPVAKWRAIGVSVALLVPLWVSGHSGEDGTGDNCSVGVSHPMGAVCWVA